MDGDIDDLKQEVDELRAMTEDTNRIVHKMRRGVWWGRLWNIVFWLAILSFSGAAYYYYAQPYVQKVEQMYASFQQGTQQAQGVGQQVEHFFGQMAQYFSAPTSTTQVQQ